MLNFNILTSCARDNLKRKHCFNHDHYKSKEDFQNNEICRINGQVFLWLEGLCYFNIVVFFKKNWFKLVNYIEFCEISCDYKFCVFPLQNIWIQKLLYFHIYEYEIFNKLYNVLLEFLHFQHFAPKICEKFQYLDF